MSHFPSEGDCWQRIAVAVVQRQDTFLIRLRGSNQALAGYWEFPGGKVQPGESWEDAAVRECREETGLIVRVHRLLNVVDYEYAHARLQLSFFHCRPLAGELCHGGCRWVARSNLCKYEFPPANADTLRIITNLG